MKLIYLLSYFFTQFASAQINDRPVRLLHYAMDSFVNGSVRLKSGVVLNQKLNYNLLTKEMIFEKDGSYLAIAQPETVDTVYLGERKFIPVVKTFYEFLGGSTFPLFVDHIGTIKEQGTSTGFGNTNTTAATPVKSLLNDGGAYKLQLPDEYQVIQKNIYYVYKGNTFIRINNEQQLAKLFPDKKALINEFSKTHHTDFTKQGDILLLIQQIQ